ncbi:unnamed protein product [Rotaria sordida]|uniref:Uncharacterized protein n=1 Tax=Rotaria sordida TaxID=392033 RepID=A0A815N5Y9_9BILA|nr:unnamed protein product [Rotaria sordida]CAF1432206.1 unnamed protein product [Rotaria sordida]CAF1443570.1 unnamed protein product [Rotaria sordida]
MSAISQKENEVKQANDQLGIVTARLTDAQAKVNQADNDVRNKENELANADGQLAEEQRKLDRARHCGIRKKRFLKKVSNYMLNP